MRAAAARGRRIDPPFGRGRRRRATVLQPSRGGWRDARVPVIHAAIRGTVGPPRGAGRHGILRADGTADVAPPGIGRRRPGAAPAVARPRAPARLRPVHPAACLERVQPLRPRPRRRRGGPDDDRLVPREHRRQGVQGRPLLLRQGARDGDPRRPGLRRAQGSGRPRRAPDAGPGRRRRRPGVGDQRAVTALLVLLLVRFLIPLTGEPWALFMGVALGLGSIAFPFATMLFGHALSAATLFAAFWLLHRWRRTPDGGSRCSPGFLAGWSVLTEIPVGLGVAVLAGYALWLGARRRARFVLGGLPVALLWRLQLGRVRQPVQPRLPVRHVFAGRTRRASCRSSCRPPAVLADLLLNPRGLLALAPWFVLPPLGLLAARDRSIRAEVLVCAAMCVAFLTYNSGALNPFGGWTPGPRYLVPMLPFADDPRRARAAPDPRRHRRPRRVLDRDDVRRDRHPPERPGAVREPAAPAVAAAPAGGDLADTLAWRRFGLAAGRRSSCWPSAWSWPPVAIVATTRQRPRRRGDDGRRPGHPRAADRGRRAARSRREPRSTCRDGIGLGRAGAPDTRDRRVPADRGRRGPDAHVGPDPERGRAAHGDADRVPGAAPGGDAAVVGVVRGRPLAAGDRRRWSSPGRSTPASTPATTRTRCSSWTRRRGGRSPPASPAVSGAPGRAVAAGLPDPGALGRRPGHRRALLDRERRGERLKFDIGMLAR